LHEYLFSPDTEGYNRDFFDKSHKISRLLSIELHRKRPSFRLSDIIDVQGTGMWTG